MNRNDEYKKLVSELESTPPELDAVISSAQNRRRKVIRFERVNIASLCTVAALMGAFVIGVNVSPAFAEAMSKVPILRELAEVVSQSPSMKTAVENDYYQEINQEQTINGVTVRIEYAVIDEKQLHIFWSATSDEYPHPFILPEIQNADGSSSDVGLGWSYDEEKADGLHEICWEFNGLEKSSPSDFVLVCKAHNYEDYNEATMGPEDLDEAGLEEWNSVEHPEPEPLAVFSFPIRLNLKAVQKSETVAINRSFTLDNKTVTITDTEISPTQMRVNLVCPKKNDMNLENLLMYAVDGDGNKFEGYNGWESNTGPLGNGKYSVLLESPYFSKSKELYLHVEGAVWKVPAEQEFKIDLKEGTAENLPKDLTLDSVTEKGKSWEVDITAHSPGQVNKGTFDFYKPCESLVGPDSTSYQDISEPHFVSWLDFASVETIKTRLTFYEDAYPVVTVRSVLFRSTQPESPIEMRIK